MAGRDAAARREALRREREFRAAYFDARVCWQAGKRAVFPPGTYWLRRFANVDVAPLARGAPAVA